MRIFVVLRKSSINIELIQSRINHLKINHTETKMQIDRILDAINKKNTCHPEHVPG